jgi:D-alanine-D-alanine ligase
MPAAAAAEEVEEEQEETGKMPVLLTGGTPVLREVAMEMKVAAKDGKKSLRTKPVRTLDLTVLMGGPSSEREVSLVSGAAVADALVRCGHKVTRCDISPQDTSALDRRGIDAVFIALHGAFGESGDVQSLCESRGLKYTGSGPRASEVAMDKAASKRQFQHAGLCTPPWEIITDRDDPAAACDKLNTIGLPAVLKPIDGGSSVDITIAKDQPTRDAAVKALLAKYGRLMCEKFIKGVELTIGILGQQALPVIQVVPTHEFYDYSAKYADDAGTRYIFEHGLSDQTVARLQQAALLAHQCLGCRDMSRVDFILDDAGTAYVLEINTIPGFTSHSLLPKAAAKAGINFEQLVDRIVSMAMQR